MSDFSDRPFVAGSLIGIRSFAVTPEHTLTGPVHREATWLPGVNEAECLGGSAAMFASSAAAMRKMTAVEPEPPEHYTATVRCHCGFYAYFDTAANPHHMDGNVLALIEGYGTVTVGSRGFRASKARIVALIHPDPAIPTSPFEASWLSATVFGCTCGICTPPPTPAPDLRAIAANYPDVRVFGTVAEALATFPLAPPPPVVRPVAPETPFERSLRLRRERNTGPADPYRLTRREAQR